ncbi:hypothetical protein SO694_00046024 [Aureococcus anophagefferens]|uniref:PHD-type domain-containing protein n=1 Tax=Aureococcus anophagefferens TaxID=44056 RepID=A0ABR1G7R3_AURAN
MLLQHCPLVGVDIGSSLKEKINIRRRSFGLRNGYFGSQAYSNVSRLRSKFRGYRCDSLLLERLEDIRARGLEDDVAESRAAHIAAQLQWPAKAGSSQFAVDEFLLKDLCKPQEYADFMKYERTFYDEYKVHKEIVAALSAVAAAKAAAAVPPDAPDGVAEAAADDVAEGLRLLRVVDLLQAMLWDWCLFCGGPWPRKIRAVAIAEGDTLRVTEWLMGLTWAALTTKRERGRNKQSGLSEEELEDLAPAVLHDLVEKGATQVKAKYSNSEGLRREQVRAVLLVAFGVETPNTYRNSYSNGTRPEVLASKLNDAMREDPGAVARALEECRQAGWSPANESAEAPGYCYCGEGEFGDMVACDANKACPHGGWFHVDCLKAAGDAAPPPADDEAWFCCGCRAALEHGAGARTRGARRSDPASGAGVVVPPPRLRARRRAGAAGPGGGPPREPEKSQYEPGGARRGVAASAKAARRPSCRAGRPGRADGPGAPPVPFGDPRVVASGGPPRGRRFRRL